MSDTASHWDSIFGARAETALTWFEAVPEVSLGLVTKYAAPGDAIIDVGGGTARLADALLARGHGPLSVLDLSGAALALCRQRLGARAAGIDWIRADITRWTPSRRYALWHDRAVFHFLTEPAGRRAYVAAMRAALGLGGIAVIATFADDGPERCSGLPVVRYTPDGLAAELDAHAPGCFQPVESLRHTHVTPTGARQNFQVTVFRRTARG